MAGDPQSTRVNKIMAGKGSKPRPISISQSEFDERWDRIFGDKNMEIKEHKRSVKITEEISRHWSDNGKREAVVNTSEEGYEVDLYEGSRFIRTVDCHGKSINYAEDIAENWTFDYSNLGWKKGV